MSARGNEHAKIALAAIELLAEHWPQAFFIYEVRRRPLAIGIREALLAALDGAGSSGRRRVRCANPEPALTSAEAAGASRGRTPWGR